LTDIDSMRVVAAEVRHTAAMVEQARANAVAAGIDPTDESAFAAYCRRKVGASGQAVFDAGFAPGEHAPEHYAPEYYALSQMMTAPAPKAGVVTPHDGLGVALHETYSCG